MYIVAADLLDHPIINQARGQHEFPSKRTTGRYKDLLASLGHYHHCRRTGNSRAIVLRDHNLVFLVLYRVVFPKCSAAQINAFLFRVNFGDPFFRFYSNGQITEAESRIGMTRKCGSTTAFQAFLPINKLKRWMYWHLPYPYGIADVKREDFIDLDECGVFVETADKHIGKAYTGNRVRQAGNYQKSEKWNLLLGIAGSEAAERWAEMWLEGGTTNIKMIEFIQKVLVDIGAGTPLRRRCFIMDNLNSHHNAQMAALIIASAEAFIENIRFRRLRHHPVDRGQALMMKVEGPGLLTAAAR